MNRREFEDQFDVLYNSITSNQAPGLDVYEKSVFLTKAQDEILLSYFDPRNNKVQEGYDGNERRQIDFSMVTKSRIYEDSIKVSFSIDDVPQTPSDWSKSPIQIRDSEKGNFYYFLTEDKKNMRIKPLKGGSYEYVDNLNEFIIEFAQALADRHSYITNGDTLIVYNPLIIEGLKLFDDPVFDLRDNTRSITIDDDILMIINESAEVFRGKENKKERLVVVPIFYQEYSRVMSKPFKRPLKYQAWRLIDNTDNIRRSEIIIGPSDSLEKYIMRYIRRPYPIILGNLDGLTINNLGYSDVENKESCELDPILHQEILQRAVELAKAAYIGDLSSQISLGTQSQTDIGVVPQVKQ